MTLDSLEGVVVYQDYGDLAGQARLEELLALVLKIHLVGLEFHPFFAQDHPGPPGVGSPLGAVELDLHRLPPLV